MDHTMQSETELCQAAKRRRTAAIERSGGRVEWRDEPCVYLDGPGRPPKKPDTIGKYWPDAEDEKRIEWIVVEAKLRSCDELVAQWMRWRDYCHAAIAVWRDVESGEIKIAESMYANPDTTLIEEAFNSTPADFPVKAGAAAAKRATPKRSEWWDRIRPIVVEAGGRIDARELQRRLKGSGTKPYTPAAQRKKIDNGVWNGAAYEDHGTATTIVVEGEDDE